MVFAYVHRGPGHLPFLRQLMPGMVERVWVSPEDALPKRVRDGLTAKTTAAIRGELKRLAGEGVLHISTRALRRRLDLGVSGRVLSDATTKALEGEPWMRDGRTLVHVEAVFGGEEAA